ncbi:hypothetical protein EDD85DRAFT_939135, partial [Armillaria nabsnona]
MEEMEQRDKAIADANQGRAQDIQFGVLRLLGYLARCFCPGPKGCVAAVLGDPGVQTGPVEVEEPPNDDKPDDDDDDAFSNFTERLEVSELSSALDVDPQAEHDVSFDDLYTTSPPSPSPNAVMPSEACLVLLLADNWSPPKPSHFNNTSGLVKKYLYECISLRDSTHRWYRLIVLGRKTSSPWLDQAFVKLLDSIAKSGFMNDLRQVPTPSSISESQVEG